MLSLEQCRKIDPDLKNVSDDELTTVLNLLYGFADLAIDEYEEKKRVPKFPLGSQIDFKNCDTL